MPGKPDYPLPAGTDVEMASTRGHVPVRSHEPSHTVYTLEGPTTVDAGESTCFVLHGELQPVPPRWRPSKHSLLCPAAQEVVRIVLMIQRRLGQNASMPAPAPPPPASWLAAAGLHLLPAWLLPASWRAPEPETEPAPVPAVRRTPLPALPAEVYELILGFAHLDVLYESYCPFATKWRPVWRDAEIARMSRAHPKVDSARLFAPRAHLVCACPWAMATRN